MLGRSTRLFVCLFVLSLVACSANPSNSSNPTNPANAANPNANQGQTISCLPPGYRVAPGSVTAKQEAELRGEELDVILGVVEGQVITKRRLLREVGGLAPGQDPSTLERQIQAALLNRARILVFVREAQRNEVIVRDAYLEDFVNDELEKATERAAEALGEPVTVDDYLRDRGITMPEYREQQREIMQYRAYVIKLAQGLGGPTRPQVDMDVTPAEVRRIYWSHPGAFDEKAGVRFAIFPIDVERYLVDEDTGFLEAEEDANADAEKIAEMLRKGMAPETVGEQLGLEAGSGWQASPEDKFTQEGGDLIRFIGQEPHDWLFDATRRPGDAIVFPEMNGPVVLTVLEQRQGRRVPYEEAYEAIVKMVRFVREQRLVETRLIEILATRNVVQPPALATALLQQARRKIAEIDRDPVMAAARFR